VTEMFRYVYGVIASEVLQALHSDIRDYAEVYVNIKKRFRLSSGHLYSWRVRDGLNQLSKFNFFRTPLSRVVFGTERRLTRRSRNTPLRGRLVGIVIFEFDHFSTLGRRKLAWGLDWLEGCIVIVHFYFSRRCFAIPSTSLLYFILELFVCLSFAGLFYTRLLGQSAPSFN